MFPGQEVTAAQLNVGDYTYEGFEDVFAVERKTLDDLATSLGAERERFEAEVERAQGLDEFIVVIEADESEVYPYAGTKRCPNYFSNIYPNSVIGTVEKWPDKYATLDFNWAGGRGKAQQETLRLLDKWYLNYR